VNHGEKIQSEIFVCTASDAFQEVGNQLQLRRRYDYWDALSSYLGDNTDPAELDDELASKLDENKAAFRQKEQEVS